VIASLNGTVFSLTQQQLVIDVAGVGYQVFITPQTSSTLRVGEIARLHTALIVREDAFTLFGFANQEELEMFDLLRSVTGVGPKSALGILAALSADQIRSAVLSDDDAAFRSVSGIGPKTAKLITVTLAGKLPGIAVSSASKSSNVTGKSSLVDLASVSLALQGLGWPERAATQAVREAANALGSAVTADALLRAALGSLGSGKSISGGDE
jgi:holliday junction DNA helicase RuvA